VFVKLSVNFICFAWLVHCFDTVELFLATFYWCSSSSFWCAFLLLCWCVLLVFVVANHVSLLISILFYVLFFVMFWWWSSLPLCYVLLVFPIALVGVRCCLHVDAHYCPCAMFCWCSCTPLATLCWCLSWPPCCILLVFLVTPLLHYVGAC